MSNDEKIGLFSFELEDDRLQTDGKIVVRLLIVSIMNTI
jgi:hypothetical protein